MNNMNSFEIARRTMERLNQYKINLMSHGLGVMTQGLSYIPSGILGWAQSPFIDLHYKLIDKVIPNKSRPTNQVGFKDLF